MSPQLDSSKVESEEKDLNRNGGIARVENNSIEENTSYFAYN
jgi:hypothetical protein